MAFLPVFYVTSDIFFASSYIINEKKSVPNYKLHSSVPFTLGYKP